MGLQHILISQNNAVFNYGERNLNVEFERILNDGFIADVKITEFKLDGTVLKFHDKAHYAYECVLLNYLIEIELNENS